MITRRKDVFARDIQQASQLSQRRALVVIGVTETQINSIALIIQFRMPSARFVDKIRDAVHLYLAFGGEPFEAFGVVDQTRFRLIRGEIHKFGQDGTSRRKQVGMISRASLVPIAERFPFLAVSSRTKDVAFGRENEIRAKRERELGHALF